MLSATRPTVAPRTTLPRPDDFGLLRLAELVNRFGLDLKTLKWSERKVYQPTGRYGQTTGECGFASLYSPALRAWVDIWYVSRCNGEWARLIRVTQG